MRGCLFTDQCVVDGQSSPAHLGNELLDVTGRWLPQRFEELAHLS